MAVAALVVMAAIVMLYSIYRAIMDFEANAPTGLWKILIAVSALMLAATPILLWIPWPWGATTN